ncbi:hypothetical protein [Massilia brevitalea]|nr:hypothetical protein [Massilia brevitalea]
MQTQSKPAETDEAALRPKGTHDRFSLTNDQFHVDGKRLRIPNIAEDG